MKTQYGEVSVARDGHIAVLEVDRPPTNFVSVDMMAALSDALEDLDGEDAIRATVLTTAGKAFCAGADLAAPSGLGGPNAMRGINQLYVEAVRLFSIKKPIVAAVQGAAVGAGLGLTLIADFRIAAPEARLCRTSSSWAFTPASASPTPCPGHRPTAAQLMCLTGRRITGEQAYAWGLADELSPLDKLRDAAVAMAREISENAPLAVEATRATFRADLAAAVKAQTDHEHIEQTRLRATKDFAEGVKSVNERRLGNFIRA